MLLQPQEVEVYYVLPAIRRELAYALKRRGRSQAEIAALLGVTGASVSHYLRGHRGAESLCELAALANMAAAHVTDRESMLRETQAILTVLKQNRTICQLHERVSSDIPKGCDVCFGGAAVGSPTGKMDARVTEPVHGTGGRQ